MRLQQHKMSPPTLPTTTLAIVINWVQRMGQILRHGEKGYSRLFGGGGGQKQAHGWGMVNKRCPVCAWCATTPPGQLSDAVVFLCFPKHLVALLPRVKAQKRGGTPCPLHVQGPPGPRTVSIGEHQMRCRAGSHSTWAERVGCWSSSRPKAARS